MWQLVFALCQPDGHGRSFGSWPWQKQNKYRMNIFIDMTVQSMVVQICCCLVKTRPGDLVMSDIIG